MNNSKIEWTDRTWNPVSGCTKVSQGCKNCYAETMHERFNGKGSFKNVTCHEKRIMQPLSWKGEQKCFVNSMSDLFHEDVPFEFIDKVFAVMSMCQNITFQILTKRPERMVEYFNRNNGKWGLFINKELHRFIDTGNKKIKVKAVPALASLSIHEFYHLPFSNVWLGVSVEDQKTADERITHLLRVPASVRFLSMEPLLGPVEFSDVTGRADYLSVLGKPALSGIHWVIVGGESGPKARPMHLSWVRSIQKHCEISNVPFFFKQWGEWGEANFYDEKPGQIWMGNDGQFTTFMPRQMWCFGREVSSYIKIGKKAAGRLLDGKEYNVFPTFSNAII